MKNLKKSFSFVLVFIVSLFLLCFKARAEEKVYQIGEITVEALGEKNLKQEKQRAPAMKEIITQDDIQRMDIKTAWDFFRNIPGISVNDYAGGAIGYMNRLSIRGVSYIFGEPYSVFLDDVPITEPGGWNPNHSQADLFAIPADSIDHVEVIKGPYSTDSGDFNTHGVIKFYTKKYADRNSITVEGGSYGYNRDSVTLSKKIDDSWRIFATGEFQRQDGYAENSDLDDLASGRVNITYGVPGKSQFTLSLGAYELDTQLTGGLSLAELEAGDYKYSFNHTDGREKSQFDMSTNFDWVINDNNNWGNLIWYRAYDSERWEDTANVWGDTEHDQRLQATERDNFGYRTKYRLHGFLGEHYASLILGFDYRRDDINNDRWKTENRRKIPEGNYQEQDITYEDIGIYANSEFNITDDLCFYLGARWDDITYDIDEIVTPANSKDWSDSVVSPKIGLTYALNKSILLFAQFATGSQTPNPTSLSEEELTQSRNWEVGTKGDLFDKKLEFLTSFYYYEISDWPIYDRENYVWVSAGDVESKGIDLSLKYHLLPCLSYYVNFGYNDSKFVGDAYFSSYKLDKIAGADPWNLATGLDWNFDFGLGGRLEYIVNGKGYVWWDYKEKEEYFHNVRLKVNYDFLEKYRAFMYVENLLNEKGKCPWPYANYYRPEPGIQVNVGLTLYF